ncbi:MAG: carbohydrate ABC transporter permease, partial [Clostridiaceae bacterium]
MNNKKLSFNLFDIINYTIISLFGFLVFYPFYNTFVISIASEFEYAKAPFMIFPKHPDFISYNVLFSSAYVWRSFAVTVFVVLTATFYQLYLTTTMAYCLNKNYPGLKIINLFVIFTMYFGGGLVPFYLLINKLNLVNSLWSLILPTGVGVGYMIIMKDYFSKIPVELEESARLEGANDIVIFFRIHMPLSIPLLVTIALYYGVERWNDAYLGMLFIKDAWKRPLQLLLMDILTDYQRAATYLPGSVQNKLYSEGMKTATIIFAAVPI